MGVKIELNRDRLFLLNTNPNGTASYKRLGKGIISAEEEGNEVLLQETYLDSGGNGSTDVTGKQTVISCAGNRFIGDAAQDYIASKKNALGSSRYTDLKIYDGDGNLESANITLANIRAFGGNSGEASAFSFEIHYNGAPTVTPATVAADLTATATVTEGVCTIAATPAEGNVIKFELNPVSTETPNKYSAMLEGFAYTGPFKAAVGDKVNIYECEYDRVVKFETVTLT